MLCCLVFTGLFASGAQAFAPAPIRWRLSPSKSLVLAPTAPLSTASTWRGAADFRQMLTVWDQRGGTALGKIPLFTRKADTSIALEATNLCIEANGYRSGDVVSLKHCTGEPTQLWDVVPNSRGRSQQIQLRDTLKCITVSGKEREGGLDEALVQLQECDTWGVGSWQFDDPIPAPPRNAWERPISSLSMQHVVLACMAMSALAVLSISVWLRRWQHVARAHSKNQGCVSATVGQDGVCLVEPSAAYPLPSLPSVGRNAQQLVPGLMASSPTSGALPAAMAVSPMPDEDDEEGRVGEEESLASQKAAEERLAADAEAEADPSTFEAKSAQKADEEQRVADIPTSATAMEEATLADQPAEEEGATDEAHVAQQADEERPAADVLETAAAIEEAALEDQPAEEERLEADAQASNTADEDVFGDAAEIGEQEQPVDNVVATSGDEELLEYLRPLNIGFRSSKQELREATARVKTFVEKFGELPEATAGRLDGQWRLVYTDAPDILGIRGGPIFELDFIGQEYREDEGTVDNVIRYRPSDKVQSLFGSVIEDIGEDRLEQRVLLKFFKRPSNSSPQRIEQELIGTKISPLRLFGGRITDAPPLGGEGLFSLPFGAFDVLYNNDRLRIIRTNAGYYAVNVRVSEGDEDQRLKGDAPDKENELARPGDTIVDAVHEKPLESWNAGGESTSVQGDSASNRQEEAVQSSQSAVVDAGREELLESLLPLAMGIRATSEERRDATARVETFVKKFGELPEARAGRLDGQWSIVYTNQPDLLSLKGGPLYELDFIGQDYREDEGTADNVIRYRPSDQVQGLFGSVIEDIGEDRLEQRVLLKFKQKPSSKLPQRVELSVIGIKIAPLKLLGGLITDPPPAGGTGPVPLPFGDYDVIYNDDRLLIYRTFQNYLSVQSRVS